MIFTMLTRALRPFAAGSFHITSLFRIICLVLSTLCSAGIFTRRLPICFHTLYVSVCLLFLLVLYFDTLQAAAAK